MTLLSLIGHQAKVTNCIRSRFCKYKPGCGVSHNSNHRAAELVTRAIPQLSQETEHFCRSVNKSCEDCPVWGEDKKRPLEQFQRLFSRCEVCATLRSSNYRRLRTKFGCAGNGGLRTFSLASHGVRSHVKNLITISSWLCPSGYGLCSNQHLMCGSPGCN